MTGDTLVTGMRPIGTPVGVPVEREGRVVVPRAEEEGVVAVTLANLSG